MAVTVDSIVESFPYPTIPPVQGRPTHQSIQAFEKLLKENAASVATELGGGMHRHMGLTMEDAVYTAVTGHNWVPPVSYTHLTLPTIA